MNLEAFLNLHSDFIEAFSKKDQRPLKGISTDTRTLEKGEIFFALQGMHQNGALFIKEAIAKGTSAIILPSNLYEEIQKDPLFQHVPLIASLNPNDFLIKALENFYPKIPEIIVAVTGTNGKTSTVHFCLQIWEALGFKAACIGTRGVTLSKGILFDEKLPKLTSFDPVMMRQLLFKLASKGCTHVAFEASSHGLDQGRIAGIPLKSAAFTNLTHDHLDYHKTVDAYYAAKRLLFSKFLPSSGIAVLNKESDRFADLKAVLEERSIEILDYGTNARVICLEEIVPQATSQILKIKVSGKEYEINLPLIGKFQVLNSLCALGLVIGSGVETEKAVKTLESLKPVGGRLEYIGLHPSGAPIYVDNAHTPDGFKEVLCALRPYVKGQLFLIFGCGGDRDPLKRPIMGKVAQELADQVIITMDNPRSENLADIQAQILKGCPTALNIPDRRDAIKHALKNLKERDILLLAGRGDNYFQETKEGDFPFYDPAVVQEELLKLKEPK